MNIRRREFIATTAAGLAAGGLASRLAAGAEPAKAALVKTRPFLTAAHDFDDVSRGNPKPHTLVGDALLQARLTPETWRLEIGTDPAPKDDIKERAAIAQPVTLDLPALRELGAKHGVKFIKAMQCLNIPTPLGQGLWEGVPLRELLRLVGKMSNVRRIYYYGFHNDDPKQLFQSSLSYSQVMETPPGELPVFVAYRLNGEPLPLERGGPVRMVVPWAHGFKSIKWLQQIVLTNDHRANDTYAQANNDPESHLKTAAYLDNVVKDQLAGAPIAVGGLAISGWSGLRRVEYWLRSVPAPAGDLAEDDPAWQEAKWVACEPAAPPADWSSVLPAGVASRDVLGFDQKTGAPLSWPLRYSMISWSATLPALTPGSYELRARAVDLNGFAQPEPRPMLKAGKNAIPVRRFTVA
ncbi:MAG TPA: molybdopterin-dependent oxidoreductase [Chthoniobacteraceae bacterium]|jgi:DMSO/TMAO reductase YedYZ molybdopterin-dependent catalytic subunit|nr:molybdopterin-dependent oxidoreductase [Chthoniobacteraceae bacterium]